MLGLALFIGALVSQEWVTFKTWYLPLGDTNNYRTQIQGQFDQLNSFAIAEVVLREEMASVATRADAALKDPAQLKEFRSEAQSLVAALDGWDHFRAQMQGIEVGFKVRTENLDRIYASEKTFQWSKDLLPVIRATAMLVFVEVFASFFLALSRREEAQALFWRRSALGNERLLALPGLLKALKAAWGTDPNLASVVREVMSTVPPVPGDDQAKSPIEDAVTSAIALAKDLPKPK